MNMLSMATGKTEKGGKKSRPSAFVLFRPQGKLSGDELSYNEEALRILNFPTPSSKGSLAPPPDMSAFCSRWAKALDGRPVDRESGAVLNPETDFIDIIESGRRRYGVRGVVLAGQSEQHKQYLFILERTSLESAHLEILFRHHRLNSREKEIVRLLLAGNCNKEIADALGLTLNTIKGYMKLLTRKLRVSGRSGIVASFVAEK